MRPTHRPTVLRPVSHLSWLGLPLAALLVGPTVGWTQSKVQQVRSKVQQERERYRTTQDRNPVTELFAKVDSGDVVLEYDDHFGYLRSLLRELDIPESSQSLVFSKTSLQMRRISPQNPRAIYFNDEVYVGWVRGSSLLEISTTDPELGAAFYTFRMVPRRISLRRETDRCLACHKIPMTQNVPGHAVRSLLTRETGTINGLERAYVTDHTSPLAERWGGWYVTGDLGGMAHMGNKFLEGDRLVPIGGNPDREDLRDDLPANQWPVPTSDVVALMVMEHQTQTQNTFTRANHDFAESLRIEQQRDERNLDDSRDVEFRRDEAATADTPVSFRPAEGVVNDAAKRIVDALLFADEATLHAPIRGSSSFTEDFPRRGPFADDGRSLREFDLNTRMFRYPCSYLIYSESFDALHPALKNRVYAKLGDVLRHRNGPDDYPHLSAADREAILAILRDTNDDFRQALR